MSTTAKKAGKAARSAAAAAAEEAKAEAEAAGLPAPALEDPPAPGLDLTVFRSGPIPAPEPDSAPFEPGDFVIQGYTLSFTEEGEIVVTDARGRRLRSVPDKLRKDEGYQALMRGRKDDRARGRRARRVLEERMISGAAFAADEIAWLVEDDAFAPLLKALLVAPVGRGGRGGSVGDAGDEAPPGLLVAWDRERGLGLLPLDYDARWVGWVDVELVHPMKLAEVVPWQDLLVDLGLQQLLPQAFRELRALPPAQRAQVESSWLSGRDTRSAAIIERALGEEGWVARRGMARRALSTRAGDAVHTVEAWFDYGEYYLPSDPTTTGALGFVTPGARRPIRLGEVPGVLFSEAIRSLEVALAQAGAKKGEADEDEEDGEGGEPGDEAGGEGGEGGEGGGGEGGGGEGGRGGGGGGGVVDESA